MRISRRVVIPIAAKVASLLCIGVACSAGSGAGSKAAPPGTSADGGTNPADADGGNAIVTGIDGGPTFINGSPDPDASDRCSGGLVGDARPTSVRTPAGYDCSKSWPLVVLLHDYGSSGTEADAYLQIAAQADALGFLYAHPDGTKDTSGNEFWNATDACCNVGSSTVDDSTYLHELLDEIYVRYNSDRNRVYVLGYGNGGFMAYRLACDHATDVAVVADLGGATWGDASKCAARAPLSVLEIHGTNDATFAYDGGTNLGAAYPSAPGTIAEWATLKHCQDGGAQGAGLDLLNDDAGTDTTVLNWPTCEWGTAMALWSIQGGAHASQLSPTFAPTVLGFLLAHKKP